MTPFATRDDAAYWGGGVLVHMEDGWISLHAIHNPNGVDTYYVDAKGRHDGWPSALRGHYVFAAPDNGGPRTICREGS